MGSPRIKVMCVDDSTRLTDAWSRLFDQQPDLQMVGSLTSADELVETARERGADVVLMDLTMDGRDPLDALAELARVCPEVRVIICSGHSDAALVDQVMDAGAWGYITKTEEPDRIMDAIRRVAGGQMIIPAHRPSA